MNTTTPPPPWSVQDAEAVVAELPREFFFGDVFWVLQSHLVHGVSTNAPYWGVYVSYRRKTSISFDAASSVHVVWCDPLGYYAGLSGFAMTAGPFPTLEAACAGALMLSPPTFDSPSQLP